MIPNRWTGNFVSATSPSAGTHVGMQPCFSGYVCVEVFLFVFVLLAFVIYGSVSRYKAHLPRLSQLKRTFGLCGDSWFYLLRRLFLVACVATGKYERKANTTCCFSNTQLFSCVLPLPPTADSRMLHSRPSAFEVQHTLDPPCNFYRMKHTFSAPRSILQSVVDHVDRLLRCQSVQCFEDTSLNCRRCFVAMCSALGCRVHTSSYVSITICLSISMDQRDGVQHCL